MALTLCDGSMTIQLPAHRTRATVGQSHANRVVLEVGSVQPYLTGRLRDDVIRKSHAAKSNHPEAL